MPDSKLAELTRKDNGEQPSGLSSGGRWAVAAVILVLALAVFLFLMPGRSGDSGAQRPFATTDQSPKVTQEQINAMVEGLAQKLKTRPDDGPGWAMLGRSYTTLRRFNDASVAYERAVALIPDDASLLVEYADVLAMTNGRNVQGEPERIIQRALVIDPNNIKALALAGTAAFQRRDYKDAIAWWEKILKLVPPESQVARSISANISQAQGIAGEARSGAARSAGAGVPQR